MHFVALPENQENASKILIFRHEFKFLQIVCRNNTKCRQADYKMSPDQNALDFSMLRVWSFQEWTTATPSATADSLLTRHAGALPPTRTTKPTWARVASNAWKLPTQRHARTEAVGYSKFCVQNKCS